MKKLVSLALTAAMAASMTSAFAVNFTGELGNEATFETLQEAHASSVGVVANIVENNSPMMGGGTRTWIPHPVLDQYPEGTTYVYRSANQYAGRAAARMNTNIFVYTEEKFADKDAAMDYLKGLGLIDIIDECTGVIVLVNPIGNTFGLADADAYYALQTAMMSQKETKRDGDVTYAYADAEYFGGYGNEYFIGIDGGATFFNNFLATDVDFIGRLAGVLTIGGTMQYVRHPATFVPMYMVNADEGAMAKYCDVNDVNASKQEAGKVTFYNQAQPLQKVVVVEDDNIDPSAAIADAYYNMFIKAQRVPVQPAGMYSAGKPYHGYGFDQAPYSLCERTAVLNGKTAGGVIMFTHQSEDRFTDIKMDNGDCMDTWYEYLPEEVVNNTAPAGSVPLLLALHGGGDDARVFVEEQGILTLAETERIGVIAPDHNTQAQIRNQILPQMVAYMLEKYPALDASRVYVTGYSMGGGATYSIAYDSPELFAAIAPFAGSATPATEAQLANFENLTLPCIMSISAFDPAPRRLASEEGPANEAEQNMIRTWAGINGVELGDFDFDTYPLFGQPADALVTETVNNEFTRYTWYLNNDAGVAQYAFTYIMDMVHCLYPPYASIAYDYMKHFSRNLETGEIIYTEIVK